MLSSPSGESMKDGDKSKLLADSRGQAGPGARAHWNATSVLTVDTKSRLEKVFFPLIDPTAFR